MEITATGTGFTSSSTVEWNGTALTTSYVSASSLTALVPAVNLAAAGTAAITVADGSSSEAKSSVVDFTISAQTAPVISSLAPSMALAGGTAFQLIVTGTNFAPTASLMWNGHSIPTSFDSATQLTAQITAAQIATAASIAVTVVNDPAPGGTSKATVFTVSAQPPVPTLTAISPPSIPAGSPPLKLTLTGSGFTPNTAVSYGNALYQPTYISPTKLQLTNFSVLVYAQGDILFSVVDPASGWSNTLALAITPPIPVISTINPATVFAAQGAVSLNVTGLYFTGTSTIYVNGTARTTTNVNGVLTAQLSAADVATAGKAAITVKDSAAGDTPSNTVDLLIQSLPPLALTKLSPASVPSGNAAFMLTVFGNGFGTSSTVAWNGLPLATTHISVSELRASVSAAQVENVGSVPITVINPANQGGTSSALALSIIAPSIDAVSFHINNAHNGYIAFNSTTLPGSPSWSVTLAGTPSNTLIVANKVYVTEVVNGNSQIVALSGDTGATIWGPIAFAGGVGITYDANTLFVNSGASDSGVLSALDASTGSPKWTVAISNVFGGEWSAATAAAGIVYMLDDGQLAAFDESDGSLLWDQRQASGDGGSVAVTVDGIYVSAPCLTNDLQPVTGEVIWTVSTGCGGGGGNTPAVNGGTIFSPIGNCVFCGVVYVAETGASLGAYNATATPAISPTTSYVLDGTELVATPLSTGHSIWTFTGDGHLTTAPIVVNNYVFVGSSVGNLYALNTTTGPVLWSTKLGAAIPGPGPGNGQTASGVNAGDGLLIVVAGKTVNAFVLSTNP